MITIIFLLSQWLLEGKSHLFLNHKFIQLIFFPSKDFNKWVDSFPVRLLS